MNPPQPPAPQAADSGETRKLFGVALAANYPGNTASKQFLDDCMMFHAAAVQAAQVKTLDYVEQQIIGKDPATQRRKLMAVRALLDGERRKDYPPILTSEVYPALTDEERRRIGEKL